MKGDFCGSSIPAKQPGQQEEGGSTPTLPLQNFYFQREDYTPSIREFVEKNHYSHKTFGVTVSFCFTATFEGVLYGVALLGKPAWKDQIKKYGNCLELRRLIFTDSAPKNIESRFIGWFLRELKKLSEISGILSYADPNAGHSGTIYKASNFKYLGKTTPQRMISWNGKLLSARAINQTKFPRMVATYTTALDNHEASFVKVPGKHIFFYPFK